MTLPHPEFTCPACGGRAHSRPDEPTASHCCADEHDIGCRWSGNWPLDLTVILKTAEHGGYVAEISAIACRAVGEDLYSTLLSLAEAVDAAIGPGEPRDELAIAINEAQSLLSDSVVRLIRLETLDSPLVIQASEVRLIADRVAKLAALKGERADATESDSDE